MQVSRGSPEEIGDRNPDEFLVHWPHDRRWIYFASGLTHSSLTVWRVLANGGCAVQLTKTASSMPIESPEGQYVYFVRFTEGKFGTSVTEGPGSEGSHRKRLTPRSVIFVV